MAKFEVNMMLPLSISFLVTANNSDAALENALDHVKSSNILYVSPIGFFPIAHTNWYSLEEFYGINYNYRKHGLTVIEVKQ